MRHVIGEKSSATTEAMGAKHSILTSKALVDAYVDACVFKIVNNPLPMLGGTLFHRNPLHSYSLKKNGP
jgi:hypothetical protein